MRQFLGKIALGIWLFAYPVQAQEFLLEEALIPDAFPFRLTYTWGDFLMGQNCRTALNQLQEIPFLSEEQSRLKDKMQTYCVGKITVWNNLLTLFRQNKKALLIDKVLKENSTVLGYIKALPYYLFDIHNTKPTGTDLSARLDKIQNAIQNKNPEEVVLLMQDLSPKEQLFFMSLFNEASSLIDFKKALSESEDKND